MRNSFVDKILDKVLDGVFEIIKSGYKKMDAHKQFMIAYERTIKKYKYKYGEDELYKKFHQNEGEYIDDFIRIINESNFSREMKESLFSYIQFELDSNDKERVEVFLKELFSELLNTAEYGEKMTSFRTDNEIAQILNLALENNVMLKTALSQQKDVSQLFTNNKFDEYLKNWNAPLFLHSLGESKQIDLEGVYVIPDYMESTDNSKEVPKTDLDVQVQNFLNHTSVWKSLIILGDPGLGKTSLISYICSCSKDSNNPLILKFKDLDIGTLRSPGGGILKAVLEELSCTRNDLRNQNLVLDGFDEMRINGDKETLLYNFFQDCSYIRNLRVIVTSRINYIREKRFYPIPIYKLQFLDEKK